MTLKFSLATESDEARWDAFVSQHPDASAYHLFAWGKAVSKAYDFEMQYWIGYGQNKEALVIAPIIAMRNIKGAREYCSLPYCDVGGILAHGSAAYADMLVHLRHQYPNMELRQSENKTTDLDALVAGEKVRMLLTLPESADALLASFKSKLRSQIRKAEKNGLSYRIIECDALSKISLKSFYAIIAENMRMLGSPVHSYAWYEAITHYYGKHAFVALVEYEGQAVGAALVLKTLSKAVIPWASTRAAYNRLAPNMLLYWAVLEAACNNNLSEFDFGRSSVGEGTFNFKKQWGARPQKLVWQEYKNAELVNSNKVAGATATTSNARRALEGLWRNLPLSVTNMLGPKVRKYISL